MAFRITVDGQSHTIEIVGRRPHLVVRIDGREHEVSSTGTHQDGRQAIEIAGTPLHFTRAHSGDVQIVRLNGRTFDTAIVDPRSENEGAGGGQDHIRAPMPGSVVSVHKQQGEDVRRGETIVTIESMKLQTALASPRDGRIAALLRREGETFDKDEVIVRLEEAEEA
jgi:3-methylcrotonyl-CoA carboxylase alpha subunit